MTAALSSLEAVLAGDARRLVLDEVSKAKTFDRALRHLRDGMRVHAFESGGAPLFSGKWVKALDQATRADGFHALHDWDGKADRFNPDIIPVEVTNFVEARGRPADHTKARAALAILLDYYFVHLLGLAALRAWDEGDPNANLDAVQDLLDHLQGPGGSGQAFARDAASLILLVTSHFEPDVTAYDRLLTKVRRLDPRHRLDLALTHAAILGCHLRFGLEVTCAGDLKALREDNVPDYPWLGEAIATLLEAWGSESGRGEEERARITEALLLGLTPDPEAFLGAGAPLREIFRAHGPGLLEAFAAHRPRGDAYSPFSFTFNFPHNLVKGVVVDAAFRGAPWALSLDDLVTAFPRSPEKDLARRTLATTLMGMALANPDTIRGRPHPAIVCDPRAGERAFEASVRRLAAIAQTDLQVSPR